MSDVGLYNRGFNFLLISRAARSVALSFSAISYPLYLSLIGFSNVDVGIMAFFVILFTILQTILLGALGDRVGYRATLFIGEIFPLISLTSLFFVKSGPLIYISVIGGIGGGPGGMRGAFSPGTTAIVAKNWQDPSSRINRLGLITSVGAFFSTFGGILVIMRQYVEFLYGSAGSYRFLFGVSAILVFISLISIILVSERKVAPVKKKKLITSGSRKHLGKVMLANAFNGAGIGLSMPIISLWFKVMYPYANSTEIGILFTLSYISTGIGSFLASRINMRGERAGKIGAYGRMLQGFLMIPLASSPFLWIAGTIYVVRMGIAGFGTPSRSSINVGGLKEGDYGAGSGFQASAARVAQTTSGSSGYLMDVYTPLPEFLGGLVQFGAGIIYYLIFVSRSVKTSMKVDASTDSGNKQIK
ncbi:MFS transporter [Cuniculiplasma sp. SKW3]|uniref:MFS transporter n=1 Tax=Cuniculiplasma sp. SKW3 TaxID=3400170 RepID=UPI003FD5218E